MSVVSIIFGCGHLLKFLVMPRLPFASFFRLVFLLLTDFHDDSLVTLSSKARKTAYPFLAILTDTLNLLIINNY